MEPRDRPRGMLQTKLFKLRWSSKTQFQYERNNFLFESINFDQIPKIRRNLFLLR